jgi:quercetin dioxygenase-like cupin family protein
MADLVVRNSGEGQAFWMLGGLYEVKVTAEETNGAMTIMQMTMPPGMGPPPHTHPGSETVYVLDGQLRYHIGDATHEGAAGSVFHIPAGTMERFEPTGEEPLRVLVVYAPGGMERFFAEVAEPAQAREIPPPPTSPPDIDRLIEAGARHGMQIQAPAEV